MERDALCATKLGEGRSHSVLCYSQTDQQLESSSALPIVAKNVRRSARARAASKTKSLHMGTGT
eukprot:1296824-Prymnesium_polylepis.2